MRFFTCSPVRFQGKKPFFERDTGLLCKGLQSIGVESKSILLGPSWEGECQQDIIRATWEELTSRTWWAQQSLDGVILYAWGRPRFNPIVRAIRDAGIFLIANFDTNGFISPAVNPTAFTHSLWMSCCKVELSFFSLLYFIKKLIGAFTVGLTMTDRGILKHISSADFVSTVSPVAVQRIQQFCLALKRPELAQKVILLPHPVSAKMSWSGKPKLKQVVVIGRWDDIRQKDTPLLIATIRRCLEADPEIQFLVFGSLPSKYREQLLRLSPQNNGRIRMMGVVPNADLAPFLQSSEMCLCTSTHESFHIASAEALCCGCSIIAPNSPSLPSLHWFAKEPFGRLAKRTPAAMSQAVIAEATAWNDRSRDAATISTIWQTNVGVQSVVRQIMNLYKSYKNTH